ncbi:CpaF family protein [Anatilimnocola floriformis]|uniref:CpaF family protein n=1 Tax=Anatilimnocola floriformis TaxID=2948575 RepID=UPI0020C249D8|nr:CpaF family protein [Anatilimnocola floriformis]
MNASAQATTRERLARVQQLHGQLVQSLEWRGLDESNPEQLRAELRTPAEALCRRRYPQLSAEEQETTVAAVVAEIVGLGPLEPLLHDAEISDILVNHPREVFVERLGVLSRTEIEFADERHLLRIIQRVASRVGRRIDESSPMVDARLPDGSRVHAVVPPLALRGPTLSIRRFGAQPLTIQNLVQKNSLLPPMVNFLAAAIEARISFLISGGTGSGKTTLLNALSAYIPAGERLVTIEDAAELQLKHEHVVALEARPNSAEGLGAVTIRDLVRNSLRMRPDRILVGEVRGVEAMDMLQAMNTGHEGSLTTIHANDVGDALSRLEIMLGMTGFNFSVPVMRQYVAAGIKLIVQLSRLKGGVRRVTRIAEITGLKEGEYQLAEIFGFKQTGTDAQGVAQGEFYATGYVPRCIERIRAAGVDLSDADFAPQRWSTESARHAARAEQVSV